MTISTSEINPIKKWDSKVAIVFLHGFLGDIRKTWGDFPCFLATEQKLASWDVFSIGYPSSLRVDLLGWSKDPDLALLAKELATTLSTPSFEKYQAIALIAHSMGGLIAQRALLDSNDLRRRTQALFLFGTPSNGLRKAGFLRRWKRQLNDLNEASPFITQLRQDWQCVIAPQLPFRFLTIAGDRDDFVPASSSLDPFPRAVQRVLPGNHLEIVKPASRNEPCVNKVINTLIGEEMTMSSVDSARLALEHRAFQQVVDQLLPQAAGLDDAAVRDLALALDGLNRGDEALRLLEERMHAGSSGISTDTMGILAGRIKRRWLLERQEADWQRARQLYGDALAQAEKIEDHPQIYYHAINVAFLDLMVTPEGKPVPEPVRKMAKKCLKHCAESKKDAWRLATEGEAYLLLDNFSKALSRYAKAIERTDSPREIHSMHAQALRVARRVGGQHAAEKIKKLFGH
ncbi:MAG: alpha/beta hydrolase [Magnetococcales bacterium]|nr:alpha/beta hydrolase [Magnetococcales bacterium]